MARETLREFLSCLLTPGRQGVGDRSVLLVSMTLCGEKNSSLDGAHLRNERDK